MEPDLNQSSSHNMQNIGGADDNSGDGDVGVEKLGNETESSGDQE